MVTCWLVNILHDEIHIKGEKQTHEPMKTNFSVNSLNKLQKHITAHIHQWQFAAVIDAHETVKCSHIAVNENRNHGGDNLMSLLQQVTLLYQHNAPHNIAAKDWNDTNLTQHAWRCKKNNMEQKVRKHCKLGDPWGLKQKTLAKCSAINRNPQKSGTNGHGHAQTIWRV